VRDAAERAARGARTDECVRVAGEPFHARLVAEDRAPGERAGRIDGEHRDAVPAAGEEQPEGFDEGRLAGARRAGDADTVARPGVRQQRFEEALGARVVVTPR